MCAEVGADESQTADPGRQGPTGLKEVFAGLHIAPEGKADAQHKDEVQQHDQPVDRCESQDSSLRRNGGCLGAIGYPSGGAHSWEYGLHSTEIEGGPSSTF